MKRIRFERFLDQRRDLSAHYWHYVLGYSLASYLNRFQIRLHRRYPQAFSFSLERHIHKSKGTLPLRLRRRSERTNPDHTRKRR